MRGLRRATGAAAAAVAIVVALSLGAGVAQAAPGDLDPSFGTGGIVGATATPSRGVQDRYEHSSARPLGQLGDGTVVIAGGYSISDGCREFPCDRHEDGFMAERIRPDGSRHPSFGENGRVATTFGLGRDTDLGQAALEPSGGIVVLGVTDAAAYVFRLEPDGTRDEDYAADGRAEIPVPSGKRFIAGDIALQSDGSAVVATIATGARTERGLARLSPSGEIDPAFPSQPAAPTAGADTSIGSLIVDSQDRILMSTHSIVPSPDDSTHIVLRFTADGAPDSAFGTNGVVGLAPSDTGYPYRPPRMVADEQDRVLVVWAHRYVARLTAAGVQDPSFGAGGVVDLRDLMRAPSGVALQTDGKILIAGAVYHPRYGDSGVGLGRLLESGAPDQGFGDGGFSKVYPPVDFDDPTPILIDADSLLAAGGQVDGDEIAAARYRLGGGGVDDLDADGVLDPADRCPGRYSPATGCPRYERTLTLRRHGLRKVSIGFDAEYLGCIRGVEIRFMARRKDRDKEVGRFRTSGLMWPVTGYETRLRIRARGPVYATMKRELQPKSGICRPARSKAVRPGRD